MALVGWLHVLVVVLGAAFVAAMLWLATWALFADRPRGRLRCPRCWYDLSHSFSLTCSECGHMVTSAAELQRTRRRWGMALLAITAVTAAGVHVLDRANSGGWLSLAPTRLLLLAVPFQDDMSSTLYRELDRRLRRGEMTDGELSSFVDRWVAGDWQARPPGRAWRDKYGRLIMAWRDALPRDGELESRLLALPAHVQLETRETWPTDVEPSIQLRVMDWWPRFTDSRVHITPRLPGAVTTTLHRGRAFRTGTSVALPWPAADRSELDFDVRAERRAGPDQPWEPAGVQTITVRVHRLESDAPQPILKVANDPACAYIMQKAFNQGVVRWSSGRSPMRISYDPRQTFVGEFDDVAIGVVIDVIRDDGAIARTLRMWWLGGRFVDDSGRNFGWELPIENLELIKQVNETDGRWFLRVRGDEALALRAGGGTRWWSGEVRLPLGVNDRPNEAPPPSWWAEQTVGPDQSAVDSSVSVP
jgi:hypothetical protein